MVGKLKNRGQVKIQQMAFMLIAVALFLVLAGLFVVSFMFSGLKNTATDLDEENARLLVSKLANSPEFSCGESFGNIKSACVDADKVMVLKENIKDYQDFWKVSNIEIRKIYPEAGGEVLCTMGNYPNCNIIRLISQDVRGYSVSNFVSLCRKDSKGDYDGNRCELAKLIVSYEEAE